MTEMKPVVEYGGERILVYRQSRFVWNAQIAGKSYLHGDPFDAFTADRALAKAKKRVDEENRITAEHEQRQSVLYPGRRPPPQAPRRRA